MLHLPSTDLGHHRFIYVLALTFLFVAQYRQRVTDIFFPFLLLFFVLLGCGVAGYPRQTPVHVNHQRQLDDLFVVRKSTVTLTCQTNMHLHGTLRSPNLVAFMLSCRYHSCKNKFIERIEIWMPILYPINVRSMQETRIRMPWSNASHNRFTPSSVLDQQHPVDESRSGNFRCLSVLLLTLHHFIDASISILC